MHASSQQASQVFQSHCISDGVFGLTNSTEHSDVNGCPTQVSLLLRRNACLCPATGIHHQLRSIAFHLRADASRILAREAPLARPCTGTIPYSRLGSPVTGSSPPLRILRTHPSSSRDPMFILKLSN